ncbi:MAG: DUF1254 domain-containing protein [Burkholderiaceae bacterium]
MRKPMNRKWPAAVLAGALSLCFLPAGAQTTVAKTGSPSGPQPTLRLVSETPVQGTSVAPTVTAEELQRIASDAYIYAYPMVLMEVTRRASTNVASPIEGKAPMNQFAHRTTLPDAAAREVTWPSTDVLYSNLWFDVSQQPLVVRVPDNGTRYQSITLLDMWTDTFASRGTRVNGNGPQTFAIVGPYWQGSVPAGVDIVRSPTSMGWLIGRVETTGQGDLGAVNQYQAGLSATPYTAPGPRASWPAAPAQENWQVQGTPTDIVANMDAATFFGTFAQAIQNNPPHANDHAMLDRLRRIGIGSTNQPFQFARLDPAVQQALGYAAPEAATRIRTAVTSLGVSKNNWVTVLSGIGTYGTDYLRRAAVAYAGLGANPPADVIYPVAFADAKGKPLDSREDYVLHFDRAQLPPVDGFWSINLYGPNFTFVENEARRYALRSTDALKYNSDGSLDIYISRKPPRGDRQSNWLPTPAEGPFLLNMRLYSPKDIALDGSWAPPPVRED